MSAVSAENRRRFMGELIEVVIDAVNMPRQEAIGRRRMSIDRDQQDNQ